MEGFTASKYVQLVLDKKPKVDMTQLDDALLKGLESFTFSQNLRDSKEELEKEINNYLMKYKDNFNKIISKVESLENNESKVVLKVVQNSEYVMGNNYLKEQGKKNIKYDKYDKDNKKNTKYDKKK